MDMKVYVTGLDGLCPKLVDKFAKDGTCPNFRKIMKNGGFSRSMSAIPAQTPENWTTIATGAWPGTHGITVWGRHDYGEPVTEKNGPQAMSSNLCKAEYLWEAAARQGMRSVLQYFVGYPPTTDETMHIDWIGWHPGKYYFEFSPSACYSRGETGEEKSNSIVVEFKEARYWKNLPKSNSTPMEAPIEVSSKKSGNGITYYALLVDPDGSGYRVCLLSKQRDASEAFCKLREGEWSEWQWEKVGTGKREETVTVRFKLMKLSENGDVFRLYRSQVYPISGFTYPTDIGEELVDKFGPYINEGVAGLFFNGLVDQEVFRQEYEYQTNWIYRSSTYLVDRYKASLYFLHWHLPDYLGHQILGAADPCGGKYEEDRAEEAWEILRLGYGIADKMVGKYLDILNDRDYLFVISDHGSATNRKRYPIIEDLAEEGLVNIKTCSGRREVDWPNSKIFIDLTNVYVNLEDRYSGGIVKESEYEDVRERVIDILRSCKDQDGEYVLSFALKREDAPIVGLWGRHIGDIIFAYSPGFTWGHSPMKNRGSVRVGGASHGPKIPTAETDISSNYATFMVIGGKAKNGYRRPESDIGPVRLVDIAPTIAHLLGMDPPRHAQGQVLNDFLDGWDVSEIKRPQKEIDHPATVNLEGDVTDSILKKSEQ